MDREPGLFGTYIQTEIGHGTFVRGMETTATYDRHAQEFVLHSPTLTSIKFWPGTAGLSANYGLVMAKLVLDNKDHGVHAFVVQLRCLRTHKHMTGVETGDIGPKLGFESHDNGYVRFTRVRVPLSSMLMRNAQVTPSGEFKRVGSELAMYACMLILRAGLCSYGTMICAASCTIAIRYSAVRRQTAMTANG
jgi:acyl-CoA oxidase